MKWIPWKFLARRAAQAFGFTDPIATLIRLRAFSQPSESSEPLELLRAGVIFHSRGVINTKAIQNNLDWVWPYWVERQFDPEDVSFIPRAFSFSHINLTHRNWTAVGTPGCDQYSVVDPRGLVTPFHDSWSIDTWILEEEGSGLFPSKLKSVSQEWILDPVPRVETRASQDGMEITSSASVVSTTRDGTSTCMELSAVSARAGWLAISLRPYNPEGIQFIDSIEVLPEDGTFMVNGVDRVRIVGASVESYHLSNYERGDVSNLADAPDSSTFSITCPAGMATAVALIKLRPGKKLWASVVVPRRRKSDTTDAVSHSLGEQGIDGEIVAWKSALEGTPTFGKTPCDFTRLYRQACATLALLSPDDIYPGPYTYRRFWFRDACLMASAVLATGQVERCRRLMSRFPDRQERSGYFRSQEGEWDSNGQVLWLYDRFEQSTGQLVSDRLFKTVWSAVRWIEGKRISDPDSRYYGLLPAGFSAEHLGPNDYYFWDDFWSIAGLEAAGRLFDRRGDPRRARRSRELAQDMRRSVEACKELLGKESALDSWPASPSRRMDSGAIGSMVADYPLQLFPKGDERMVATLEYLMGNCLVGDAFFQDMIHSGMNAYLTLDLAQSLMRLGDPRYQDLVRACVRLASSTGQWPEAIHPITLGGCMGDGQHGWAAAEWIMFIRNAFVCEEDAGLVVGSGVMPEWLENDPRIWFGPTPTPFGNYTITIQKEESENLIVDVDCEAPRGVAAKLKIAICGYQTEWLSGSGRAVLQPTRARTTDSGQIQR